MFICLPCYITWRTRPIASRVRHVVYTSPAKNTITYTHQGVISSSRRQDSPADGPRRSCTAFWRQISTADRRFNPAFGRGPVMVLPIVSHGLTSLRPLYYSLEGIAITVESSNLYLFKCFDFVFQCLRQVDPKGLTHFSTFRLLFSMPSSGWNQRA